MLHCADTRYQTEVDIDPNALEIIETRYKDICVNPTVDGDWDVGQFSLKDLFFLPAAHGEKYCIRKSSARAMLKTGKHPFLNRHLTPEEINIVKNIKPEKDKIELPLSFQLHPRCPLWQSDDPHIAYQYVCDPTKTITDPFVTRIGDPSKNACVGTLHKYYLKNAYDEKTPEKITILADETIQLTVIESEPRPNNYRALTALPPNAVAALELYMGKGGQTISSNMIHTLKEANFTIDKPMTLFRGLSFPWEDKSLEKFMDDNDITGFSLDREYTYIPNTIESWTTNPCVALSFAKTLTYGIVCKYSAPTREILFDTRLLNPVDRSRLYPYDQAEVILVSEVRKPRTVKTYLLSVDGTYVKQLMKPT